MRQRVYSVPSVAYFEFAPANGAGMTAACACSALTGSKGEAMTFTRASSATCLSGNTTTGIANGAMSTCSANQPRVAPGGDGSGVISLLVESTRQSNALNSEDFGNATWSKINSVAAAPIVTTNATTAPDGTVTADRVQFAATSGTQYSVLYNASNCPTSAGLPASLSVFVKGNGQSGVLDLGIDDGSAMQVAPCAYVAGSWTRCRKENVSRGGGVNTGMAIGNGSVYTGVSRAANDVFLWGADCENGANITSYIPAGAISATRNVDVPTFTLSWPLPSFSSSQVVISNRVMSENWIPYEMFFSGPGSFWQTFAGSSGEQVLYFSATAHTVTSGALMTLGVPQSLGSFANGSLAASCVNGTCVTSALSDTVGGATGTLYLGRSTGTSNVIDGYVSQFCLDSDWAKCVSASQTPSVTWMGDSLSAFGTPSAPSRFSAAFHKRVSSGATSGAPFDYVATPVGSQPGCKQQWTTNVTQTNSLVLFCGINTFLLSSETAANLWSDYQAFIDARVAEGRHVTVVTITPCGGHADCSAAVKTKITTFNSSLLSWCASNPTQGCVNLYSFMDDGTGALWSYYDSGDHVHFTSAGYDLLANTVGVAVGP